MRLRHTARAYVCGNWCVCWWCPAQRKRRISCCAFSSLACIYLRPSSTLLPKCASMSLLTLLLVGQWDGKIETDLMHKFAAMHSLPGCMSGD